MKYHIKDVHLPCNLCMTMREGEQFKKLLQTFSKYCNFFKQFRLFENVLNLFILLNKPRLCLPLLKLRFLNFFMKFWDYLVLLRKIAITWPIFRISLFFLWTWFLMSSLYSFLVKYGSMSPKNSPNWLKIALGSRRPPWPLPSLLVVIIGQNPWEQ